MGLYKFGKRIKAIPKMLKDKKVPWTKKALLIFGIIYLFLPVDLIPPLIPVFGWLDDILIWAAILYFFGPDLDVYLTPGGREKKYRYKYSDVTEAEFTINKEEEAND